MCLLKCRTSHSGWRYWRGQVPRGAAKGGEGLCEKMEVVDEVPCHMALERMGKGTIVVNCTIVVK